MEVVAGGLTVAFSYVGCCWWVNGGLFFMEVVAGGLTVAFSYVGCCWWVNGGLFLCRLLLVR